MEGNVTVSDRTSSPSQSSTTRRDVLRQAAGLGLAAALTALATNRAGAAVKPLIALVHTQAAGDAGPIDDMIAAIDKLGAETGAQVRKIYAQDPATFETILRNLGDAGAAIVGTTFTAVTEPLKAVAADYPNTYFIQIYADPINPPLANVRTVSYDEYLASYLSGIYGASVSTTGSIGYIGGASVPSLNADYNAMKAGALSVNPHMKVTPAFVGSFQDPSKAREIAAQIYQSGADYIQTDSAGSDPGIIQAANERPGAVVSGTALATAALGPKTMQTTVIIGFGAALYNQAKEALGGKKAGGHHAAGIKDGGIDFRLSPIFLEHGDAEAIVKAKAVWPTIETARKAIVDGSLTVAFKTDI
jgi:basic membrane protein A and related proteins